MLMQRKLAIFFSAKSATETVFVGGRPQLNNGHPLATALQCLVQTEIRLVRVLRRKKVVRRWRRFRKRHINSSSYCSISNRTSAPTSLTSGWTFLERCENFTPTMVQFAAKATAIRGTTTAKSTTSTTSTQRTGCMH